MCGRFALSPKTKDIEHLLPAKIPVPEFTPRYNIAPTQEIDAIIKTDEYKNAKLRWGLVPFWAKDISIGTKLINARSESIIEKPAFKNAFKKRRCLILTSGFYEWKKLSSGKKQPYFIRMKSGYLFAFAGIWEEWKKPDGEMLYSTSIITTEPNELMADIHNRMPVILTRDNAISWLDDNSSPHELLSLLLPYNSDEMEAYEVSTLVNNPANDNEKLIEKL